MPKEKVGAEEKLAQQKDEPKEPGKNRDKLCKNMMILFTILLDY